MHHTRPMFDDLQKILFHESTILSRLDELAVTLTEEYREKELTVLAVMTGSLLFGADLLRRIHLPLRIDSIRISSYHGKTNTSGTVTFDRISSPDLKGRHVLILDDILDTGLTLHSLREKVLELEPASVKICVLLRKSKVRSKPVDADFVGFDIGDEFVVGYGLDYEEHYRNLPSIGVLKPNLVQL